MPVFETAPVVLEFGKALTKIGFAAESYPRFIIPSKNYSLKSGEFKNIFEYVSETEAYEQLVDFVQNLFFKYLLVSPKEKKVVIVECSLCPTSIRNRLAEILFRHFEVASILYLPTHLVILSTLAIETALIVDIGYEEAIVVPVYCGVQVMHAWDAQPLAAKAVHAEIRRQLIESGVKEELLTDDILEDIKIRLCFVTHRNRAEQYRNAQPPEPCPDVSYPINSKEVIKISGVSRETAFEVLFPEDNDRMGLPYIILDAIIVCPVDMRQALLQNICLVGGTSMAMGLQARLKSELMPLLGSSYYKNKLFGNSVKFHSTPAKENFAAWQGGSIYGGTDLILSRTLTKEAYAKECHVPDWID